MKDSEQLTLERLIFLLRYESELKMVFLRIVRDEVRKAMRDMVKGE